VTVFGEKAVNDEAVDILRASTQAQKVGIAAEAAGLSDNQAALLKVAKESTPEGRFRKPSFASSPATSAACDDAVRNCTTLVSHGSPSFCSWIKDWFGQIGELCRLSKSDALNTTC
jgi:hypothetical protein